MDERERNSLLDEIGGEALEGSGFELETPTTGYELEEGNTQEDHR